MTLHQVAGRLYQGSQVLAKEALDDLIARGLIEEALQPQRLAEPAPPRVWKVIDAG